MATVFRPGLFAGQVAIVTGGGTGIGRAVSQQLVELGATVTVAARREEHLKETATELTASGPGRCDYQVCNIRKPDEVTNLVETVIARHRKLDLLVNNAGGQFISPAADIRKKGWDAVIDTNLSGTFSMCQTVYQHWMKQHGGAIVNVVADMFDGFPYMAHTGASRAGVENLTKTLAIEWCDAGVRVNVVAPGVIYSPTAAANYPLDVFGEAAVQLPSYRCGTTHEVAAAICFLLSPGASYINGATMRVDGASSVYKSLYFKVPPHDRMPPHRGESGPRSGGDSGGDGGERSKM